MIGTIQTFNLSLLKDLALTKVELGEFVLKLYFGEHQLNIEEYWEYQDPKQQSIDRSLSAKFREEFKLPELVGRKLIKLEHVLETFIFYFDNQCALRISSPNFEFMDMKQYKAFGDGYVGKGA